MDIRSRTFISEFGDQRGWRVVLAAAVGFGCSVNILPFYTLGVFVGPLQDAFGWSRVQIQGSATFITFATLLVGWLVGSFSDRYGVRPVALVSQAGLACGLAVLALAQGNIVLWYSSWLAMAIAGMGTSPITWTRGIATWFDAGRGLALAFGLMGSGLFGIVGPPLTALLIETVGWRGAYLALAALVLCVALPVVWFCFHERTESQSGRTTAPTAHPMVGVGIREALLGHRFWLILASTVLVAFGLGGLISNLVPLLTDKGVTLAEAASSASIIGVAIIVGRLITGYLLDRIWAPYVGLGLLALPSVGCLLLYGEGSPSSWMMVLSAACIGLASGAEFDILAYICSRYFGLRHYGELYAYQWTGFAAAGGIAPPVFGLFHDVFGTYDHILSVAGICFLAAPLFLLALGEYRQFTKK